MNSRLIAKLIFVASLIANLFVVPAPSTFAASFDMAVSTAQVAPGGTFTVTVSASGCTGRVNFAISGGTINSIAAILVENNSAWVENNSTTATIIAGGSGSVIVTATPEYGFSNADGDLYNPGSRTVTVAIVAPAPAPQPSATSRPAANNAQNNTQDTDSSQSEDQPKDVTSPDTISDPETDNSQSTSSASTDDITPDAPKPSLGENISRFFRSIGENLALAWVLAWAFFILFLLSLSALIYVIIRHAKNLPYIPAKFTAFIADLKATRRQKTIHDESAFKKPSRKNSATIEISQPKSPKSNSSRKSFRAKKS